MLISLPKAMSPYVVIPLLSVTHGQCDATADLYGYLPSRKASPPIGWYQIILLGDRGTCVLTTCPGCTRQRRGQDSNSRPIDRKSSVLTTRPPSHTVKDVLLNQNIDNYNLQSIYFFPPNRQKASMSRCTRGAMAPHRHSSGIATARSHLMLVGWPRGTCKEQGLATDST